MIALQALTPEKLAEIFPAVPLEEARKIVSAVHRRNQVPPAVAKVRRRSLEIVRSAGIIPELTVLSVQPSTIDPFIKYALRTTEGQVIESVRIPLERAGRFSVC